MSREMRKYVIQQQLNGDEGYVAEKFIKRMREDDWDVKLEGGVLIFEILCWSSFESTANIIRTKWEYFRDGFMLGYATAMENTMI